MFIILLALVTAIFAPMGIYYLCGRKHGKPALVANLVIFFGTFLLCSLFVFSDAVYASNEPGQVSDMAVAAAFIGAALVTGLGAVGTGIAVSHTAAAAIAAISENENNFGKSMVFVAMSEGIAIYGLLISFMILGRV